MIEQLEDNNDVVRDGNKKLGSGPFSCTFVNCNST